MVVTDSGNTATTPAGSENVNTTPTPDEGRGDMASEPEWTEEEIEDFWADAETGVGSFDAATDGYGQGVEIEITPTP